MRIDLHNHTTMSNHASGTIDEYIQRAIELKIDIYGFSDHAPMRSFDDGYRLQKSDMPLYEKLVLEAQERYKKDITVLLGYEVDFMANQIEQSVLNANVDYLIGSVHYLNNWGFDNPEFISGWQERDVDTIWQEYFDTLASMAQCGHFDIVGHFDLIKVFKFLPKKDIRLMVKDALTAIKKADMVVEINASGLRKPINEPYPTKAILEMIYERDIPITFSSDAHSVADVGYGYEEVKKIAQEVGFKKVATFNKRQRQLINF